MTICPLLSGSSGNATYVASGSTRVLIDAGATGTQLENSLRQIGVDPRTLTCLLATHAHSDHISGLGVLSRRYRLPIYASIGVWDDLLKGDKIGRVPPCFIKVFRSINTDQELDLGELRAKYFSTPHDAYDSVGYVLTDGKKSFGLATDFGHVTPCIRSSLFGCDVVLLEANHDVEMLLNGPYPYPLKQRILSDEGHLSNEAAGRFAVELVKSGVKTIYLGHLSLHNNTQRLAYDAVKQALLDAGLETPRDVEVYMTRRDEPSRLLDL